MLKIKNSFEVSTIYWLFASATAEKTEIQSIDFISFAATYPTFFSAKKVAKKLESGMRSFSPILRLDRFGDFYELRHGTQVLVQYNHSLMQAFILKNKFVFFSCRLLFW